MRDQQAFCLAEWALCGVEVNNPRDKEQHLESQMQIRAVILTQTCMDKLQINTTQESNLLFKYSVNIALS